MNTINGKFFIQDYYRDNGEMASVAKNQDDTKEPTDVGMVTISVHDDNGVVETTTAMLKTDGSFTTEVNASGLHYISVRGVNSLEVFSNGKINIQDPTTIDFTTAGAVLGNNVAEVEAGVFAAFSGDVNGDGVIDATDVGLVMIDLTNSNFGVLPTDLNGDGTVDSSDTDNLYANVGKSVMRP